MIRFRLQYFRWVQNALQGDFGVSYKYRQPVTQVIRGRIGNTVILGGIGFVITFAGALLLGLLCAAKENSVFDRVMCKVGTLSSCIPEFWLSLVFILLFSVIWRILPSSGAYSIGQEANLPDRIRHLIMPMAGGDTGASLVLRLHDPKPASGGNQTGLCAAL